MTLKSWFDDLETWKKVALIIVLVLLYPVGIIFAIAYGVSWLTNSSRSSGAIESLQAYLDEKQSVEEAKKRIVLKSDERLLYAEPAEFLEERAVRNYVRSGHSFRVMKGWWYHMGSGQSESHGELRKIDTGILYVTSKRFMFTGTFKNYTYTTNKILSIEPFSDAVRLAVEGRQKTLTFTSVNPLLLGASLQIFQEGRAIDAEGKDLLESELKRKLIEKMQFVQGNLKFNVKTHDDQAIAFELLRDCVQQDVAEYGVVLNKLPSDVREFQSKVDDFADLLRKQQSDLHKIRTRYGDAVKRQVLQDEFDAAVDKKYGKESLRKSLDGLASALNELGAGKMSITVTGK